MTFKQDRKSRNTQREPLGDWSVHLKVLRPERALHLQTTARRGRCEKEEVGANDQNETPSLGGEGGEVIFEVKIKGHLKPYSARAWMRLWPGLGL